MVKNKNKKKSTKIIRTFKNGPILWYVAGGLIFVSLVAGTLIFLLWPKNLESVSISPENPKQGDTIFIKVESESNNVTGNFGSEQLVFYRKGKLPEWIAFLGIDADQNPGDYNILINTGTQQFTKDIAVGMAGFSSTPAVKAPNFTQNGITQARAINNIIKNDNPVINKILSNFTPTPYFSGPFSFPLSSMQAGGLSFGKFISFAKYKLQHFGVDLRAAEKTNIYAVNDGKVVLTADLSNYGKTVIIDHGLDIFSMYLHLDEFKVSVGDTVKRGQLIGLSGETGYVTAPHLHFSMRVGSSRVDPITFINTTQKMNDTSFLADISSAFLNIINKK